MRLAAALALCALPLAAAREVVVTIDDLPVAQSGARACEFDPLRELTARLLAPLRERRVPATAFVIGGSCPGLSDGQRRAVLTQWREAGVELGNHTWSHPDLNRVPIEEYERDVLRAQRQLDALPGAGGVKWFRWPFLHAGKDAATRQRLETFLAAEGLREAPVTFDNSDWMFAFVYARALEAGDNKLAARVLAAYVPYMESVVEFFEGRSVEVAGREFPQVLLIHANRLNARALPDLLAMLERRGYRFVPLGEAVRDPAYRLPNTYAGPGGFSWIHRWSMTRGMRNRGEPDEPEWLRREFEKDR